jgi:broad specificity phosphatase PhoE
MSSRMGRIVVLRHGETEWSRVGRHTGRTDIALTEAGEERARGLGDRLTHALPDLAPGLVLASPLVRARRTAELAGFAPDLDPDLLEWDYGDYEGRTTDEIRDALADPTWSVWTTREGLGETVEAVGERTDRVIERCRPVLAAGSDVVLAAHAHLLRILAARWLELPADRGRSFVLAPAGIGVLSHERQTRVLAGWNL